MSADIRQYVTVGIGNEIFALEVTQVREVLDLCPLIRVPNMPEFMLGVIDVRGHGVPVVDMRRKFGLPAVEPDSHARIVVLEMEINQRPLVIGALTDRVYEVAEFAVDTVEAPPELGVRWRSDIIGGISRRGEALVILLNLHSLFSSDSSTLVAA